MDGEEVVNSSAEASATFAIIPARESDSIFTWEAGTATTEFGVYDTYDLIKLAAIVNAGNSLSGVTIKQKASITFNDNLLSDEFEPPLEDALGVPNSNYKVFDGIGNIDHPFAGKYIGSENSEFHYVSGAYIYGAHQGLGFFGATNGAEIDGLYLIDSCVVNKNETDKDGTDDDRFGGIVGLVNGNTAISGSIFVGCVGSAESKARGTKLEYLGGVVGRVASGTLDINGVCSFAKLYYEASGAPLVGKYGTISNSSYRNIGVSYTDSKYYSDVKADAKAFNIINKTYITEMMSEAPAELVPVAEAVNAFVAKLTCASVNIPLDFDIQDDGITQEVEETSTGYKVTLNYDSSSLQIDPDQSGIKWEEAEITFDLGAAGVTFEYGNESPVLVTESSDFEFIEGSINKYKASIPLGVEGLAYTFKKTGFNDTVITFVFEDAPVEVIPEDSIRNYDGNGTAWSVYNFKDLKKLASLVNGGTNLSGVTITQKADIAIQEEGVKVVMKGDWEAPAEASNAQPNADLVVFDGIGNKENGFAGTYDGQGYKIEGAYVYGDHQYLGFFGRTDGATLKNIVLLDACCVTAATADGTNDRFGGLIGDIKTASTVENCVFVGTVGSAGADYTEAIATEINNKIAAIVTACRPTNNGEGD